jgi:hypothetical protein
MNHRRFRKGRLYPAAIAALPMATSLLVATMIFAQRVRTSDLESFETYLRKRLPGLIAPSAKSNSSERLWVPNTDPNFFTMGLDQSTGLVPPKSPFPLMEKLPTNDPRTNEYRRQLTEFLENRDKILQVQSEYLRAVGNRNLYLLDVPPIQADYLATKISAWNGDIFWAPASKSTEIILRAADEVRAVFGPIPNFDVTTLGQFSRADGWTITTAMLPTEVDGNIVQLKPNPSKRGNLSNSSIRTLTETLSNGRKQLISAINLPWLAV